MPTKQPDAADYIAQVTHLLLGPAYNGNVASKLRIVNLVAEYFQKGNSITDGVIVRAYRQLVADVQRELDEPIAEGT